MTVPRNLRVAMVAACPVPLERGTPVRIVRVAEALADRGHQVHLVAYHLGSGTIRESVHLHRTPRVRTYSKLSPGPTYQKLLVMDPLLALTLRRLLSRTEIDLIHAHHYEGLLVARTATLGRPLPLVYDAHTLLASELPAYGLGLPSSWKRSIGRRLDRSLPRMARRVVSVTDKIKDRLQADGGIPEDRISVISSGVELELFEEDPERDRAPQEVKRIAFTGNLAPYQGIDLLLQSLAVLASRRDDVRLTIASEASFEPYEALATRLGIRHLIDLAPVKFAQVPSILADSDIAVSPRVDCDGVPQKVLNYMAAARPVVAFKGSAPGLSHDQTAWLVDDGDVSAFADGIMVLVDDFARARRIGKQARAYVKSHHSWSSVGEKIEQAYLDVLGLATPNERL